jgi:hypothetical protein
LLANPHFAEDLGKKWKPKDDPISNDSLVRSRPDLTEIADRAEKNVGYYLGMKLALEFLNMPKNSGAEILPEGLYGRAIGSATMSYGQFVIWPFLLTLALALRITKVTIEIFGWARKSDPFLIYPRSLFALRRRFDSLR